MRTIRSVFLSTLALLFSTTPLLLQAQDAQQSVPVPPCRLVDTRSNGGPIQGGTARTFDLRALAQGGGCSDVSAATLYSLNVTVVPQGRLGYLTIWPTGQPRPTISLMNSLDGRVKANAAIVPGGTDGKVDVYVTDTANVILDIDGFFEPATSSALAFYPLTPCRVIDTRSGDGGYLHANEERDFDILASSCIPSGVTPVAYSFNVTAVPYPAGQRLGYLSVWPKGQPQPTVSTLNNPTGTVVANAALVPAGSGGEVAVYPNNTTHLLIDINGYFARPMPSAGLALYALTPCRALDTRPNPFTGLQIVDIAGSGCGVPGTATGYVLNATALPQGRLGYLNLWPDGQDEPVVSVLNATDGAYTSNMAIVGTTNGSIDADAHNGTTNLLLDISSYLAPLPALTIPAQNLPDGTTGQSYQAQLLASGGEPPYGWELAQGSSLPPGLVLSANGVISGIPTAAGTFPFTVQVTDTFANTTSAQLSITVAAGGLVITTSQLPAGEQGVGYNATLGAAGGTPPYTWSVVSGSLPAGLTLDGSTGVISGTPTTLGASDFTVQVEDALHDTAQAALQIVINAATTNNSLNGHYAFSFNGYNHGNPVLMAGSFVADGNGHISSGILDFNDGHGSLQNGYSFTGSYQVTADGLGTMAINVSTLGVMNFHLSVSNGGNGALIQDNQDPNTRGSGVFFVQVTSDFMLPPQGNYAMGSFGADENFKRYAKAGVFQVGANGVLLSGTEDLNDNGTLLNRSYTGQFYAPSGQTGRGQVAFDFPNGATNNYAYYIVSRGQFIALATDPVSSFDPLLLGSILAQVSGGFNNASLRGVSVYEVNGLVPNGNNPLADAVLGLINADGAGTATATLDENRGGDVTQHNVSQGTYNVAANGRVTLSGFGGTPPILYLSNTNQGFVVGQDDTVASGILEWQTAIPPYNNLSIIGNYLGATSTPVEPPIVDAVSFLFADGNGNVNGIQDYSGPSGSGTLNISETYQVDSTGRAAVNVQDNLAGFLYVVSNKRIVFLPTGNNPALSTFNAGLTSH